MNIDYRNDNTFIFSFVRMNPPTPGHLLVIQSMINRAIQLNVNKVYVLLSNSMDEKNPIPCSVDTIPKPKTKKMETIIAANSIDYAFKSDILKEMVQSYKEKMISTVSSEQEKRFIASMEIIVMCSSGNPFGFIDSILYKDFVEKGISDINIFFIVGQDRSDFVDRIVEMFEKKDYVKSIDAQILPREGMTKLINKGYGETSVTDIPLEQFSASFVRKLVKNGNKTEFDEIYKPYLQTDAINKLFDTIANGLIVYGKPQKSIVATVDEEVFPESYYIKNKLLPIVKGGKNRRTKITKRTKKTRKNRRTKKTRKNRRTKKTRKTRKTKSKK
jgi:nicotinic acid mononucleotide adenylyltransferase